MCDANCLTCDSDGKCTTCKEEYRVDSGSCTGKTLNKCFLCCQFCITKPHFFSACPAFCLKCTLDEETNLVSCDTCDKSYGSKSSMSKTCDGKIKIFYGCPFLDWIISVSYHFILVDILFQFALLPTVPCVPVLVMEQ